MDSRNGAESIPRSQVRDRGNGRKLLKKGIFEKDGSVLITSAPIETLSLQQKGLTKTILIPQTTFPALRERTERSGPSDHKQRALDQKEVVL